MKLIINSIFKIHIKLFKIPSKMHVKYALYKKQYSPGNGLWRISMLYACGLTVKQVSEHLEISEKEVKVLLNTFIQGVRYE